MKLSTYENYYSALYDYSLVATSGRRNQYKLRESMLQKWVEDNCSIRYKSSNCVLYLENINLGNKSYPDNVRSVMKFEFKEYNVRETEKSYIFELKNPWYTNRYGIKIKAKNIVINKSKIIGWLSC